jgi:hypothetical protein
MTHRFIPDQPARNPQHEGPTAIYQNPDAPSRTPFVGLPSRTHANEVAGSPFKYANAVYPNVAPVADPGGRVTAPRLPPRQRRP